jgi:hypothetical protein
MCFLKMWHTPRDPAFSPNDDREHSRIHSNYTPTVPDRRSAQQGVYVRAKTRKKLEMGKSVLEFSRQHPDPSPGFTAAVALLQERLARADQLARQQFDGRSEVHAATARKRELRRLMKRAHLHHLSNVAELAAEEEPEMVQKLKFPSDASTYLAFQTAAEGMAAEAESRKELLMKHGLSDEVVSDLKVKLGEFDAVVQQGSAGRLAHVGASAELLSIAEEIVQVVQVMNGLVRIRFANQEELLAAWESASSVVAIPKPETKPATGTGGSTSSGTTSPGGTTPSGGTPPSGGLRPAA